jgi:hypothetical protein
MNYSKERRNLMITENISLIDQVVMTGGLYDFGNPLTRPAQARWH